MGNYTSVACRKDQCNRNLEDNFHDAKTFGKRKIMQKDHKNKPKKHGTNTLIETLDTSDVRRFTFAASQTIGESERSSVTSN